MSGVARAAIVAEARRWIGTPYAHQASLFQVGCDCLGLLRGVWRALYGAEPAPTPPYAPSWSIAAQGEPLLAAAQRYLVALDDDPHPGDVLLFHWRANLPAAHVAILVAEDRFVHAHDGAAVAEIACSRWWRRHRAGVFSFPHVID